MSDKVPAFALLDETNYHEWVFFMEAVLIRKDLLDVVDGSVTQPMGSPNSKIVKAFIHKQKLPVLRSSFAFPPHNFPMSATLIPRSFGTISVLSTNLEALPLVFRSDVILSR
jgi:hypothetical protein